MSWGGRGLKHTDRSGYVYLLTNPAWAGYTKVGAARSLARRLSSYNTGSPHRDYAYRFGWLTPDRYRDEAMAHGCLAGFRVGQSEWFRVDPHDAYLILNPQFERYQNGPIPHSLCDDPPPQVRDR